MVTWLLKKPDGTFYVHNDLKSLLDLFSQDEQYDNKVYEIILFINHKQFWNKLTTYLELKLELSNLQKKSTYWQSKVNNSQQGNMVFIG